eukprot:3219650-Amphidinium_carterae.1
MGRSCRMCRLPGCPELELVNIQGHLGIRFWLVPATQDASPSQDITVYDQSALGHDGAGENDSHPAHVALHLKDLPQMSELVQVPAQAEAVILGSSLPRAVSRTNLSSADTFGITFGGYTRRGIGVTIASFERAELLEACLQVAKTLPLGLRLPFLSMSLTRGTVPLHCDQNASVSLTIALGQYTGGQLQIKGQSFFNRHRWVCFDAREPHKVAALTSGERTSLTLFMPKFPGLRRPRLPLLIELGSPTKQWAAQPGWLKIMSDVYLPPSVTKQAATPERQSALLNSSPTSASALLNSSSWIPTSASLHDGLLAAPGLRCSFPLLQLSSDNYPYTLPPALAD